MWTEFHSIQLTVLRNSRRLNRRNILSPLLEVSLSSYLVLTLSNSTVLIGPAPILSLYVLSCYSSVTRAEGIGTRHSPAPPRPPHPGNVQNVHVPKGDPVRIFQISSCELRNRHKLGNKVFQDPSPTRKTPLLSLILPEIESVLQRNRVAMAILMFRKPRTMSRPPAPQKVSPASF